MVCVSKCLFFASPLTLLFIARSYLEIMKNLLEMYLLYLQARYALEIAELALAERIEREVKILPRQTLEILEQDAG